MQANIACALTIQLYTQNSSETVVLLNVRLVVCVLCLFCYKKYLALSPDQPMYLLSKFRRSRARVFFELMSDEGRRWNSLLLLLLLLVSFRLVHTINTRPVGYLCR